MKRRLANSDDETDTEIEFQSLFVSNYHLEDDDEEPTSFSVLPIYWKDSESFGDAKKELIFLHGSADNGLRKIFMQVIAWRFDLSGVKPEISLLSKDKRWIKLQKPRKSFQDTVRTVLITVYFLHSLKKNPRLSATSIWNNLRKNTDLSSYGFKPSEKDLLDHMPLIGEAAKRNAVLARSELLLKVLREKPGNQKLYDEQVDALPHPGPLVDNIDNDITCESNEDSYVEDNLFNSVCSFCDNGGNLTCCEGGCMRSFHATKEDGQDSFCDSLGFTQKEVDETQSFWCKNCEYHQHQCFACGKLGSSDKVKGAEVIKCAVATCDTFYHPRCVAKLLPQVVKDVADELEKKIADGNPFTCPIHYCCVCKGLENKMEPELQFAVCRRCPKSYHRKCLPREIVFDCPDDEDIKPRAWEGLLPNNRILIYCLNHEIVDKLGTPKRDHIKFPDTTATIRKISTTNKRMKPATQKRAILKKNSTGFDKSSGKSTVKGSKVPGKLSSTKVGSKLSEKVISGSDTSRKRKSDEKSSCLAGNKKPKNFEMPSSEENKQPTGEKLCAGVNKGSEQIKHDNSVDDAVYKASMIQPIKNIVPPSDADSERRNHEIFDELGTPIRDFKRMEPATKKTVKSKNIVGFDNSSGKSAAKGSKLPGKLSSAKVCSMKSSEKMTSGSDTSGKLKSNEKSGSRLTENKKSISKKFEMPNSEENKQQTSEKLLTLMNEGFEPMKHDDLSDDVVNMSLLVKPIRSVFPPSNADSERSLLDFSKEARSSSLMDGAIEKHTLENVVENTNTAGMLEDSVDIVDKLHWYVQNGDTLVDFCCGANDFSILMEKKLEDSGKKCSYKNYDLLSTKNDFSFEKRDLMTAQPTEFPTGSQLIVGLNFPFGFKTAFAHNFLDKVLGFKPKLLILIAPPETERLDKELSPYDLVWEDKNCLSGLSFDLPGSVDVNDRQIDQRNVRTPLLSLWSHPDWTTRHNIVALGHGHHKKLLKRKCVEENASLAKRQAVNGLTEKLPGHSQPNPIDGKSYSGIEKSPSAASPLSYCRVTAIEEHHSLGEAKDHRESDKGQQIVLFEVQNPNSRESDHPCAPRPDSLNHVGISSLGPENCQVTPPGFAAGRNIAYSQRYSSVGWLDE